MNAFTQITEPALDAMCVAIGITIIYEDRAAGLRAKRFSDLLTELSGAADHSTPACWRFELIELPEIADLAARDAAASEFVIFSLRGDTSLSIATRGWIESWLADGPASLVALFDPERSRRNQTDGVRYYLRQAAADAGVAFFAHCPVALREPPHLGLPRSMKSMPTIRSWRSPFTTSPACT
jgi:hypothetical protein